MSLGDIREAFQIKRVSREEVQRQSPDKCIVQEKLKMPSIDIQNSTTLLLKKRNPSKTSIRIKGRPGK